MVWSTLEDDAIVRLESDGFSSADARIVTAMVSRRYAREKPKLIDVLSGHIGLENTTTVSGSIQRLLSHELLTYNTYDGVSLVSIAHNYQGRLQTLHHTASATALEALERAPVTRFESLGSMTEPDMLRTFKDAVSGARQMIRLPLFSSLAQIEGIDELAERARAGVQIRVLVGSPAVIRQLRGASHMERAKRAIESWTTMTRNWPNTEVRVATDVKDVQCGSSLSVDGRLLRLDVHEPLVERSLMGEMLLVRETGGNLIRLFDGYFDTAWERAASTKRIKNFWRHLTSFRWTAFMCIALPALTFMSDSQWRELFIGVSSVGLLAMLDENRNRISTLLWRVRHGQN